MVMMSKEVDGGGGEFSSLVVNAEWSLWLGSV